MKIFNLVEDDANGYHSTMVTLYKWQEECLERWKEVSYRGVIEVTTGGGKTLLASVAASRRIKETDGNIHVYVIVPRIPLLEQWRKTLNSAGIHNVRIQNQKKIIPAAVSIFTINRARDVLPLIVEDDMRSGRNVLLILDEFHHYGSPSNYHLFDFRNSIEYRKDLYSALGLSATAEVKGLETKLIPAIGPLFYRYSLKSAISDSVVNDFVLFNIAVALDSDERESYDEMSDSISTLLGVLWKKVPFLADHKIPFTEMLARVRETKDEELIGLTDAIQALILKRRGLIATAKSRYSVVTEILKTANEDDKVLIFTERITQVEELYFLLKREDYDCCRYTSDMDKDERRRNLNSFKDGEKRILIACKALDEGLDVPDCNIGIFMASTSAKLQRIQRSGRIIRKGLNKLPSLLYYIYCDNTLEDEALLYSLKGNIHIGNARVTATGEIVNDGYYDRVFALLKTLKRKKFVKEELMPLIKYGNIRPEQFWPTETLENMLASSSNPFFRSYLSLMILLSRVSPYEEEEDEEIEKNPYLL